MSVSKEVINWLKQNQIKEEGNFKSDVFIIPMTLRDELFSILNKFNFEKSKDTLGDIETMYSNSHKLYIRYTHRYGNTYVTVEKFDSLKCSCGGELKYRTPFFNTELDVGADTRYYSECINCGKASPTFSSKLEVINYHKENCKTKFI